MMPSPRRGPPPGRRAAFLRFLSPTILVLAGCILLAGFVRLTAPPSATGAPYPSATDASSPVDPTLDDRPPPPPPTHTRTPVPSPTRTATPSPTRTPFLTSTRTPTASETPTLTPFRPATPTPSKTPTRTPTPAPTMTPPATRTSTPTRTVTPSPTRHVHRAWLPLVPFPRPPTPTPTPVIENGGFEAGLTGWRTGGALGVSAQSAVVHGGAGAALLGNPGFACDGGVPIGEAYVAQTITVPANGHTLSFWYRMFTQDVIYGPTTGDLYDSFDVYVNVLDDPGHLVFRDGNRDPNRGGCDRPTVDLGWRNGVVDLDSYAGQRVTLYFVVENRRDNDCDTWAYLDDVAMTPP